MELADAVVINKADGRIVYARGAAVRTPPTPSIICPCDGRVDDSCHDLFGT